MRHQRPAHSQRGVALVFAAISLLAALAALALAVDIGRLYFERRDLQRAANMAALDAARIASGCLGPVENPAGAAYAEVRASLVRNRGGDTDLVNGGAVTLGRAVPDGGILAFAPESTAPSAVQVQLARDLPARLISMGTDDTLKLRAVAAARALPMASLSVGSRFLDLDPDLLNRLLGEQFGGPLDLSVLSYNGLFNAVVGLGDVAAAADLGTPTDFLDTRIGAGSFIEGLSNALSAGVDDVTRDALQTIAAASDASRQIVPGEVFGVPPGFEQAASEAVVNVGAVTEAAAQAANGQNLIVLPADLNIPGVTGPATVTARLIQTANPVVGSAADDTQASNAQAAVQIDVPLLPILGTPARLRLWAQLAQATAQVVEIECARSGQPQPVVHVRARTSAARLGIGEFDDISGATPTPRPAPLVSLNLLGVPVRITASAMTDIGQAEEAELIYRGPFDAPQTQRIGSSVVESLGRATGSLTQNLRLEVEPAGALLNPLLAPLLRPVLAQVADILAPVLGQLDEQLLTPVLSPLGLTLGGADVTVTAVTGDQPVLFKR